MQFLLIFQFLCGGFVQKWYIPRGNNIVPTEMQIMDTDKDGNLEFIFTVYGGWPAYLHFYELHLPDVWEIDSFLLPSADLLWDGGDFDNDGLCDLVIQFHSENPLLADGIAIFASPDSFSYPTQEVWRDTVGFGDVQPISVYDVDRDGYLEIFKLGWLKIDSITVYYPFGVYECTGNNLYDTVFMAPTALGSLSSTMAFGDFDADSLAEFVIGNIDGYYQIWECTGNNVYQCFIQQQLLTANIKDCFSVADADGDGKLEFVVKGFTVSNARVQAYIFEATADNTYEIVKTFDLAGGYNLYGGGYSEAGDVDGDSIPEMVLEGCQGIYVIKSMGNDSFYVWETLPGNLTSSSVRVTNDLDNNGLNEIVISGNNQTRIYEYEPEGVTEETSYAQGVKLKVFPNPFREKITISWQLAGSSQQKTGNRMQLNVYNSVGQLVRCLTPTNNNTQLSTTIWFGDDNAGRKLPPGVYFMHVPAGEYKIIIKVILVQ
jgi:hypothetical protein